MERQLQCSRCAKPIPEGESYCITIYNLPPWRDETDDGTICRHTKPLCAECVRKAKAFLLPLKKKDCARKDYWDEMQPVVEELINDYEPKEELIAENFREVVGILDAVPEDTIVSIRFEGGEEDVVN